MSTDREFASYLRSLPRELSGAEVECRERRHDSERGPYIPHGQEVHHSAYEARH